MKLEMKNGTLRFGRHLVADGLCLSVSGGQVCRLSVDGGRERVAVLWALMGLLSLESGHVSVDGLPLTLSSAPFFRRQMAFVPAWLEFPFNRVSDLFHMVALTRAMRKTVGREWQLMGQDGQLLHGKLSALSDNQHFLLRLAVASAMERSFVLVELQQASLAAEALQAAQACIGRMAERGSGVVVI